MIQENSKNAPSKCMMSVLTQQTVACVVNTPHQLASITPTTDLRTDLLVADRYCRIVQCHFAEMGTVAEEEAEVELGFLALGFIFNESGLISPRLIFRRQLGHFEILG
jgi:hypothetical protein